MVVLEVYKRNIKVRYKSTLLSKATFLTFLCGVLTYTLPFIFAYKSGGFWLKTDVFFEQPRVNLLGDYLLVATNDNSSNPIVCSTYPFYKRHLNHLDFCSLIKLREVDDDLDGKIDKIIVNFRMNFFKYKINSINLILPLKYQLNDICPLHMQSAIIYQHYFHQSGGTHFQILADLMVHQTNPIYCDINTINNIYNESIIDVDDDGKETKNFEIDNIIEKYLERNITTHLTNVYTNVRSENNRVFNLKLSVRYPQQRIYYKPGFWQIIKAAWVQYSAVYTIIAWGLLKIKSYFFRNRLVFYYEDSPLKKNI
ncbi:transmembrane protein 231 [Leptinotarsa decemlineata]|uniref:transmembrane protein 231 n=1 Tax=Leptinotarsa decemlineata TaxID=7539 RepID=UPI003D30D0B4